MTDQMVSELAQRLRQELEEISRVLQRMHDGWERARHSNDDFYIDGVALNLHGFYLGAERIFTHIAEFIDGNLPRGEHWHLLLLQQMRNEIPGIRPAVISAETGDVLDDLRRFRHVVRNVYTHRLDPVRLGKLVKDVSGHHTEQTGSSRNNGGDHHTKTDKVEEAWTGPVTGG